MEEPHQLDSDIESPRPPQLVIILGDSMRGRSVALMAAMGLLAGGMGAMVTPGSAVTISARGPVAPDAQTNPVSQPRITKRSRISVGYGGSSGGYRNYPPRTVAQDKRDARKLRNRKRGH